MFEDEIKTELEIVNGSDKEYYQVRERITDKILAVFESSEEADHYGEYLRTKKRYVQIERTNTLKNYYPEVIITYYAPDDIVQCDLPVRAYNCLLRNGTKTISELWALSPAQLLRIRNMGKHSVIEVLKYFVQELETNYDEARNFIFPPKNP